ncbi:MAG: hypothetical protein NXI31_00870 [bacterium]|nr:hypothetical protein [bacterium]
MRPTHRIVSLLALTTFGGLAVPGDLTAQSAYLIDSVTDKLYTIDPDSGSLVVAASTSGWGLTTPAELTFRRVTQELWTVDYEGGEVGTIDRVSGRFAPAYTAVTGAGPDGWYGIAWHERDKRFYLCHQDKHIYSLDPMTGTTSMVGYHGLPGLGVLETDADGELYGIDYNGTVVSIDRTTGATTVLSTTVAGTGSFAIEPVTGDWYTVSVPTRTLAKIDPSTGAVSASSPLSIGIPNPRGLEFVEGRIDGYYLEAATKKLYACNHSTGARHYLSTLQGVTHPVGMTYVRSTGKLWVAEGSLSTPNKLGTIDPRTGVFTPVFTPAIGPQVIDAVAWDERHEEFVFFTVLPLSASDPRLLSFDPVTLNVVVLDTIPCCTEMWLSDLSVDAMGNVFGVDGASPTSSNGIYQFDRGSGVWNFVAAPPSAYNVSVDQSTGSFFLASIDGHLREVDRGSHAITQIGNYPRFGGGWYEVINHAPAYVIDMSSDQLGALDLRTGVATAIGSTLNHGLTAPADLAYQASSRELWAVDADGGEVGRIDPTDGTFTPVFDVGDDVTGLAWHEGDGRFYLGHRDLNVYALDLTGEVTLLGPTGTGEMAALDTDASGNLIGLTHVPGEIVVIDRVTGAATVTATTTVDRFMDLGIDQLTGDIYAVRHTNDGLYSIDPVTGVCTLVGTFGSGFPVVRGFELIESYGSTIARTMSFGTSCGGVFATTQSEPQLLSAWNVDIVAPQTAQLGVLALGFSNPELSLGSFGAPGCTQYVDAVSTQLLIAPFGSPTYSLAVPAAPGLVGLPVFVQGYAFLPGSNPLGLGVSGGLQGRVGW